MSSVTDDLVRIVDTKRTLEGDVVYQLRDSLNSQGHSVTLEDVDGMLRRLAAYGELKLSDRNRRTGDKFREIDLVLSMD